MISSEQKTLIKLLRDSIVNTTFTVLTSGSLTMETIASTVRIVSHRTNTKEEKRSDRQTVTQELLHVRQKDRYLWFCGPAVPFKSEESLEAGLAGSIRNLLKRDFSLQFIFVFTKCSRCAVGQDNSPLW